MTLRYTPPEHGNMMITSSYDTLKCKILQTDSQEVKYLLLDKMLSFTANQERLNFYSDLLLGNETELGDFPLTIEVSWRIVEMMCAYPEHYGEDIGRALEITKQKDNTDLSLAYTLKIQALQADDSERESLIATYMSGSHSWSVTQLHYSIKGFISNHIHIERKEKYFDYYFDHLLESLRTQSLAFGDVSLPSNILRYSSRISSPLLLIGMPSLLKNSLNFSLKFLIVRYQSKRSLKVRRICLGRSKF